MRHLRTDIQALRAIAVLSVLLFHFEIPGLQKGYLGVDVFFVISGYLMSGVIINEMDQGRFSAARFYLRRARRLLPAAFATMLLVTMAAPFVLTGSLLRDYAYQLMGAASFSANIVLWQQSGYFDGQAALKPLLHTWSLALEEQYYFVLPLILAVLGRRWRLPALLGLTLGSMAACMWALKSDPSGAFYLLPMRAWELLIGSLCALPSVHRRLAAPLPKPLASLDIGWLCLPVMGYCLIQGVDPVHPRGDALLICLATAGLIVRPSKAMQSTRAWMRPVHWIGDRSYSLYLVHWPLIALTKSIWLEGVPREVTLGLLLISLVLAHASYVWIEQPFRHINSIKALGAKLSWLLLPLLLSYGVVQARQHAAQATDWSHHLQPNYGFARSCDQERDFKPRPECANTPRPRTLVWGDSYAMHLVPALLASSPDGGLMQATRSACSPLLDMARQMPNEPANRARRCLSFNQAVLSHLSHTPDIEFVVLSSRWEYFFTDPIVDSQGHAIKPDAAALTASLAGTISRLRQMGKKVIVMGPPASIGPNADLGLCTERRALHLWTVMPSADEQCRFSQTQHEQRHQQVIELMDQLEAQAHVHVIRPDLWTCRNGLCLSTLQGTPLYRDMGHLSHEGARTLGKLMNLKDIIQAQAR